MEVQILVCFKLSSSKSIFTGCNCKQKLQRRMKCKRIISQRDKCATVYTQRDKINGFSIKYPLFMEVLRKTCFSVYSHRRLHDKMVSQHNFVC